MTYLEAVSKKNNLENPYIHNGNLYTIFIIPAIQKEYIRFLADLKEGKKMNDENIREYSSNGDYKLVGLMMLAYNITEIDL